MADWGLKLSQAGFDVKTATNSQLIFTTGARTVRVFATGTTTVTIPSISNSGETVIFLTYYATSGEMKGASVLDYMPSVIASTVMNGKRYRSNTPSLYMGATSPDDFHSLFCFDTVVTGQASRHFIDVGRTAAASTAGTTENFLCRWYILGVM